MPATHPLLAFSSRPPPPSSLAPQSHSFGRMAGGASPPHRRSLTRPSSPLAEPHPHLSSQEALSNLGFRRRGGGKSTASSRHRIGLVRCFAAAAPGGMSLLLQAVSTVNEEVLMLLHIVQMEGLDASGKDVDLSNYKGKSSLSSSYPSENGVSWIW